GRGLAPAPGGGGGLPRRGEPLLVRGRGGEFERDGRAQGGGQPEDGAEGDGHGEAEEGQADDGPHGEPGAGPGHLRRGRGEGDLGHEEERPGPAGEGEEEDDRRLEDLPSGEPEDEPRDGAGGDKGMDPP